MGQRFSEFQCATRHCRFILSLSGVGRLSTFEVATGREQTWSFSNHKIVGQSGIQRLIVPENITAIRRPVLVERPGYVPLGSPNHFLLRLGADISQQLLEASEYPEWLYPKADRA
jgi:hypothetical protein